MKAVCLADTGQDCFCRFLVAEVLLSLVMEVCAKFIGSASRCLLQSLQGTFKLIDVSIHAPVCGIF